MERNSAASYTAVSTQLWSKLTHAAVTPHRCTLRIAADHPALPGHFPGRPIVPGVVLLDCVLTAAEQWLGRALGARSLRQAKFNSMLLPEETADLELQWLDQGGDQELRFAISRSQPHPQVIAQGSFTVVAAAATGREG